MREKLMRKFGIVTLVALTTLAAQASNAAASLQREPFPVAEEDNQSLASANDQGDRPAWADPYADPPEFNIYDDPAPFFPPGDTDSSSDDTGADSAFDLDGF
jgi:hypothetical protein